MTTISHDLREERKLQARLAHLRKILTAYGYGCLAAGFAALLSGGDLNEVNPLFLMVGLAMHAWAIYLGDMGAHHDD